MSAESDDLKSRVSLVRLRGTKQGKLAELVDQGKWKDAARLKAEIDGKPVPTGVVVRFDPRARRR